MTSTKYAIVTRRYVNIVTGHLNDVLYLGTMSRENAGTIHGAVGGTLCEVFEGPAYQADRPMGGGYETAWVRDTLYMAVGTGVIEHTRRG
jgi:hypothetical protein